jgi:hypothetical protein
MDDLESLKTVVEAQYDQQRQIFAKIIHEEEKLRTEIARINDLSKASRIADNDANQMQAIGADVLWSAWINRSITTLNLELAKVLSRKMREQERVKRIFGKLMALNTIIEGENTAQRKNRAKANLTEVMRTAVLAGLVD